jgi:hypothetical protein
MHGEAIRVSQQRARTKPHLSYRQGRVDVQGQGCIDSFKDATLLDQHLRPPGRLFLCWLEHKLRASTQRMAGFGQQLGSPEDARDMRIVATSMHRS